jgi:hypothetical protein
VGLDAHPTPTLRKTHAAGRVVNDFLKWPRLTFVQAASIIHLVKSETRFLARRKHTNASAAVFQGPTGSCYRKNRVSLRLQRMIA